METITVSTNENNNYSVSELNYLVDSIQSMNKYNQIGALRLLHNNKDIVINECSHGININLSILKKQYLDELTDYVNYINAQESELSSVERQKEDYKNTYFSKDIKDISNK